MDSLPEELVLNILHRLPVKSLGLCICVKKNWVSLIKSPTFVSSSISKIKNNPYLIFWKYSCRKFELRSLENNRLDIYNNFTLPLDPRSYDINCGFPICNGILCLAKCNGRVMLWNPTIRKLLTLPKSNLPPLREHYSQHLQFWFDSLTDDYKVIRFVQRFGRNGRLRSFKVEICSLTCNCWKIIICDIPYKFEILGDLLPILNGTLHWIVDTEMEPVDHSIVGFDVNAEVFRKIELPNVLSDPGLSFVLATYKQTSIAVICHHFMDIGEEVWVMKEYDNVESWTKIWQFDKLQHPLLRVPRSRKYRLNVIGLLNNGEVLWEVLLKTCTRSDADPPIRMVAEVHMLYLTNLERKENVNLEVLPHPDFKFGVSLKYFEESLVLLDNANATTL